jgi:hypothetical protein
MNLYAVKMPAVFMISTSTLAIRTGFFARSLAFLGYAFALFLLLSGRYIEWILMLFPIWVLLISIYILIDNLRGVASGLCDRPVTTIHDLVCSALPSGHLRQVLR